MAVCGFVTNADGDLLLVRVEDQGLGAVRRAGRAGEGLLDALVREVEEESGCVVEPERLLSVSSRLTVPEMLVLVFACRFVDGVRAPRGSRAGGRLVRPGGARRLVTRSPAAERLTAALVDDSGVRFLAYRMQPYVEVDRRLVGNR